MSVFEYESVKIRILNEHFPKTGIEFKNPFIISYSFYRIASIHYLQIAYCDNFHLNLMSL